MSPLIPEPAVTRASSSVSPSLVLEPHDYVCTIANDFIYRNNCLELHTQFVEQFTAFAEDHVPCFSFDVQSAFISNISTRTATTMLSASIPWNPFQI